MDVRGANLRVIGCSFVNSILGGLSLVNLISSGFMIGWIEPLRKVVEQYLVITNTVRHAVEPFVVPTFKALAEALNLTVTFGPRWPDIFLLMLIYLGSRVRSYIVSGKYVRATAMLANSLAISITSAFFASSVELETQVHVMLATSIPLLGFMVYDLIYACVGASFDRLGSSSWTAEFRRHLLFSTPLVLLAFALNLALAFAFAGALRTQYQSFVLIFTIDYALISAYWAFLSLRHARQRQNRMLGESTSERFWRSTATNVSLNVGFVLVSAVSFILLNGGMQPPGLELRDLAP